MTASASPTAPTTPRPLADWLAQAQDTHAGSPQAVADGLREHAPALPADDTGAQALRLAEHLWLGHLADPAGLADWLEGLPPSLLATAASGQDSQPALAQALARCRWALAAMQHPAQAAAPALDEASRWRALQNVVLALAHQGRGRQARALLLADEQAAAGQGASDAGRAYAACANNVAAHLQDSTGRDAESDQLMLDAAALSLRAWSRAGTWLHQERAEYRLALCHAALGQGEAALAHARRCLQACQQGDGSGPADTLEHFFAHEALARAHHAAGDAAGRQAAVAQMRALLPTIDETDGLRAWCAQALADLPGA